MCVAVCYVIPLRCAVQALACDLVGFLDSQSIDKAVLIGHSMGKSAERRCHCFALIVTVMVMVCEGGKTVMAASLLHPNRVDKLVVGQSMQHQIFGVEPLSPCVNS